MYHCSTHKLESDKKKYKNNTLLLYEVSILAHTFSMPVHQNGRCFVHVIICTCDVTWSSSKAKGQLSNSERSEVPILGVRERVVWLLRAYDCDVLKDRFSWLRYYRLSRLPQRCRKLSTSKLTNGTLLRSRQIRLATDVGPNSRSY